MFSRRWLIAAVAACVLASACSQFNTNLSIQTSSSSLSFLSPATATIGSIPASGLPITANGSGFVTGAFILWNGAQLADTTFVSSNTLTATVPASNFPATATGPITAQVAVQIPGSAVSATSSTSATTTTELSNIVLFTINPPPGPAPVISSLSAPSSSLPSTPFCSPAGFLLTVNGSNFVNGSVVNWNGAARQTNFISSTQLTAAITSADTASPNPSNVILITVSNPSGPAPSNSMPFTLTTPASLPAPVISSLSQTSAAAGSAGFLLTVNGSSFVPCSVVRWGTSAKATTYVSATQLNATILPADVSTSGPVNVTVFTPTPGGGTSAPIVFTITP